ncbi:MAG: hypothetical protein E3K32_10015 [wastewater metagenome]|nr:hypothetical protein [Candidatus Loosdrechtia aerotolerans]
MSLVFPYLKGKLQRRVLLEVSLVLISLFVAVTGLRAETVVIHADTVWKMTDVVVQEKKYLQWKVEKNNQWCFNPELFPNGHSADGIPVEALKGYVFPGQPIGMLIGRIGDSGRMFPMGTSGIVRVLPDEDGEFLYLSMNDDIFGLYGKGFQDNTGVIAIEVYQAQEK